MNWGRSLTFRVTLTLLIAFVALFVVLLVVAVSRALSSGSGEIDQALKKSAEALLVGIEPTETDETTLALLRMFESLEQSNGVDATAPRNFIVAIRNSDKKQFATPGTPSLRGLVLEPGEVQFEEQGRSYRGYLAVGSRWNVLFLDPEAERRRDVVIVTAKELAGYMAIALPLIVLPVWLAVQAGMRPLRILSAQISAREPSDVSPIRSEGNYEELVPLERALNQQFSMAAERIRREQAFVHDAAHELRTPLAVITTQAHVLAMSDSSSRESARRKLEAAVVRCSHLVQQLLALARADEASWRFKHPSVDKTAQIDLMELLPDTLALLEPVAREVHCELSLEGPEHALMSVDKELMRSIIVNLVDNALKYGKAGGSVEVVLAEYKTDWTLTVSDRGPGLSDEFLERAFERFWRRPGEVVSGSGLGLAIVREVVRGFSGDVHFTNRQGGGSSVITRWPKHPP